MQHRPTGTVTFLFTDVEGSTKNWEHNPGVMEAAHARQEAILRQVIEANGGYAYKMIGDAFQVAFSTAHQALQAAIDAQRALHNEAWEAWGEIGALRVRMALHTGVTDEREGDYVGPVLNRIARLMSAGHGGQVLLTLVTAELVRDQLPAGVALRDMGEHRLKDLIRPEHTFQLVISGLPSDFPPLKTLDSHSNNLPLQPTTFVGRAVELASVLTMLQRDDVRLLTLTGAGGTGKTRLGLQAAAEVVEQFRDGVFFVNLAPIADPALAILEIAQTLGVRESGGKPVAESLKEYLKDKEMLLLLDNFEQIVSAGPTLAQLLASAPKLKALVTSRAMLHLQAEREFPVPPLGLPPASTRNRTHPPNLAQLTQYESVRLFIERAVDAKPDFEITNENAPAVAEICYRLDGLPLAIELAAARIKVLPPQAMLARLESRMKLLTGGARDLPTRQQTLRGAIDWSYDLLDAGEKTLFMRLAPFVGGCTLEAIEAVCNAEIGDQGPGVRNQGSGVRDQGAGLKIATDLRSLVPNPWSPIPNPWSLIPDVLDGVESLLNKSLLRQTAGASGEPLIGMLETIHEYAWEKLAEADARHSGQKDELLRRHARYFMQLAEEAEPQLRGDGQALWLARLEDAHGNLRAALQLARESSDREDLEIGLRLAGALYRFWSVRGYFSEGRAQIASLLSKADLHIPEDDLSSPAVRATELAAEKAKALLRAGALAWAQGDYLEARRHLEASLALYRVLENEKGIAHALLVLGNVAYYQANQVSARALYEESLQVYRKLNDKQAIATALLNLGNVDYVEGDYGRARSLLNDSLAIRRELRDKQGVAQTLHSLADVISHQRDYAVAQSLYTESLQLRGELEDKWGIIECLEGLACLAVQAFGPAIMTDADTDDADPSAPLRASYRLSPTRAIYAARLWGAAEALREIIGVPRPPTELPDYEQTVSRARTELDASTWGAAWAEGRAIAEGESMAALCRRLVTP